MKTSVMLGNGCVSEESLEFSNPEPKRLQSSSSSPEQKSSSRVLTLVRWRKGRRRSQMRMIRGGCGGG
ncbi:hypothetical protein L484_006717 [Morus notabilis]|uniref:Uncharacterized protein n=1 Tax=Morus notabilis TaxID=981085 RepID=W9RCH5_9ROSA|nr:hypothetical protein L484_006717 [Morus notabilis]